MNERGCEAVGIDLGTTYSSLAFMDSQSIPRIVSDSSGKAVRHELFYFGQYLCWSANSGVRTGEVGPSAIDEARLSPSGNFARTNGRTSSDSRQLT